MKVLVLVDWIHSPLTRIGCGVAIAAKLTICCPKPQRLTSGLRSVPDDECLESFCKEKEERTSSALTSEQLRPRVGLRRQLVCAAP